MNLISIECWWRKSQVLPLPHLLDTSFLILVRNTKKRKKQQTHTLRISEQKRQTSRETDRL